MPIDQSDPPDQFAQIAKGREGMSFCPKGARVNKARWIIMLVMLAASSAFAADAGERKFIREGMS